MKNKFYYECISILKGSITEEEAKKEVDNFEKYLKNFKNLKIIQKENNLNGFLGLKNLAYEIDGEPTGYFAITYFTATPEQLIEIKKYLRINNKVMKFITLKHDN